MSLPRRPRISPDEWKRHKSTVQRLYLEERRKLEGPDGVIDVMQKAYNFRASKAQFEAQLTKWKFRKYSSNDTWKAIAAALESRGNKSSEVYIHGKLTRPEKLRKELRRHRYHVDTLSQSNTQQFELPAEVQIRSPGTTYLEPPVASIEQNLNSLTRLQNSNSGPQDGRFLPPEPQHQHPNNNTMLHDVLDFRCYLGNLKHLDKK